MSSSLNSEESIEEIQSKSKKQLMMPDKIFGKSKFGIRLRKPLLIKIAGFLCLFIIAVLVAVINFISKVNQQTAPATTTVLSNGTTNLSSETPIDSPDQTPSTPSCDISKERTKFLGFNVSTTACSSWSCKLDQSTISPWVVIPSTIQVNMTLFNTSASIFGADLNNEGQGYEIQRKMDLTPGYKYQMLIQIMENPSNSIPKTGYYKIGDHQEQFAFDRLTVKYVLGIRYNFTAVGNEIVSVKSTTQGDFGPIVRFVSVTRIC